MPFLKCSTEFLKTLCYKQDICHKNLFGKKKKYLIFQSHENIVLLEIYRQKHDSCYTIGCFYDLKNIKNFKDAKNKNIKNLMFEKDIPRYRNLDGFRVKPALIKIFQKEKGLKKFIEFLYNSEKQQIYQDFFEDLCAELYLKKIILNQDNFNFKLRENKKQYSTELSIIKFNNHFHLTGYINFFFSEIGKDLLKKNFFFKKILISNLQGNSIKDFQKENYKVEYHKITQKMKNSFFLSQEKTKPSE